MIGIPLYKRPKGRPPRGVDLPIAAFALIDDADLGLVSGYPWRLSSHGYANTRAGVYMHRVVLGLEAGDPRVVDHINGNKLDNRRSNLRAVDMVANGQNRNPDTHPFRGSTYVKREGIWRAQAAIAGERIHIGRFKTQAEAAAAAAAFRRLHMPYSEMDRAERLEDAA